MATHIRDDAKKLHLEVCPSFLSERDASALLAEILANPSHFHHAATTKAGKPSKRRNKTIYGDGSMSHYTITYRGETIRTPIRSWRSFPALAALAQRLASHTGHHYTTCVVQIYNTGAVGIKPHRDKEMRPDSIIASVSLGATRTMRFHGRDTIDCSRNPVSD